MVNSLFSKLICLNFLAHQKSVCLENFCSKDESFHSLKLMEVTVIIITLIVVIITISATIAIAFHLLLKLYTHLSFSPKDGFGSQTCQGQGSKAAEEAGL